MSAWFKKLFGKEASKPDASFVASCAENPSGARAYLASDQARLGAEIEEVFRAYDARLASLASRVKTLSEDDLAREMESIREAQDGLRRIVRRFQAALKSTAELDQELDGWEGHPGDEATLHADHPLIRSEIVRSELLLRHEEKLREQKKDRTGSGRFVDPGLSSMGGLSRQDDGKEQEWDARNVYSPPLNSSQGMLQVQVHEIDPVRIPDEAQLIAAIRDAVRETNRWHALENHEHTQDAADQVRQMKQLHGILKRLDAQKGIRRDRSAYWPEMQ